MAGDDPNASELTTHLTDEERKWNGSSEWRSDVLQLRIVTLCRRLDEARAETEDLRRRDGFQRDLSDALLDRTKRERDEAIEALRPFVNASDGEGPPLSAYERATDIVAAHDAKRRVSE